MVRDIIVISRANISQQGNSWWRDPFRVFIMLRILISPLVLLVPFWGFVVFFVLDSVDPLIYNYSHNKPLFAPNHSSVPRSAHKTDVDLEYHSYDKLGDLANEVLMAIVTVAIWGDSFSSILLFYRLVGVSIWYLRPWRIWFLIFPNVFGSIYVVQAFVRDFFPNSLPILQDYYFYYLLGALIYTLVSEWFIHFYWVDRMGK